MSLRRSTTSAEGAAGAAHHAGRFALSVGALGVVYGDIGTNPLFALREAFESRHSVELINANVIGLLSLMFWSLIIVVSLKYLTFVMRADNDGEGGILALAALAVDDRAAARGRSWVYALIGILGAALLYGDGMITPAISVLAAVEGTAVAAPRMESFVVPVAIVVLIALFVVQHRGTASIGRVFGPIMVVWFVTIAMLGLWQVLQEPTVLQAVNPSHAASFFARNGFTGFLVLGAVILVVVGGEALYADMGHFSRRSILLGWYLLVLPSLVLVYFGQGALLVRRPEAIENPFFKMAPEWALVPLVLLATMATVIASQALISGAYSLTLQAIQLGYSPRLQVRHTSDEHIGQIYIPAINWLLMLCCIGLVLGFGNSANLAAAYGVAVTTTMVMTTMLFYVVARHHFRWSAVWVTPLCATFFIVDAAFFVATMFKVPDGGWFPLVVGVVIFSLFTTWRTGRRIVNERLLRGGLPIERFIAGVVAHPPLRTPGTGAYLFAQPGRTPPALVASLRHNDALHEQILVVSVRTDKRPRVPLARRAMVSDLGDGFHQVVLTFGFMEKPNVPSAMAARVVGRTGTVLESTSWFIGRESVKVTRRPGMVAWREHLYRFMARNASDAAAHFELPPGQTVELSVSVEL